jgi:hypothetical protein
MLQQQPWFSLFFVVAHLVGIIISTAGQNKRASNILDDFSLVFF